MTTQPGQLPVFDTIQQLGFEAVVTVVMTNLIATAPFFGAPIIRQITYSMVSFIFKLGWEPTQNYFAFKIIDANWNAKTEAFEKINNDLKEKLKHSDIKSEEVKKAHEEFKTKLGSLIRLKPR